MKAAEPSRASCVIPMVRSYPLGDRINLNSALQHGVGIIQNGCIAIAGEVKNRCSLPNMLPCLRNGVFANSSPDRHAFHARKGHFDVYSRFPTLENVPHMINQ